jgi:hypothetical protein
MHAGGIFARESRKSQKFYLPIVTLMRYQPISARLLLFSLDFTK